MYCTDFTELLDVGTGEDGTGEGTFKRLLILPGHCCCHQVGHVTELCILKERERTTEGGAGQKQLKTFRSTAACPFSSCTSFEFRAHPILPIDDGSSFPYGERAFQIQRFAATTDHISAPTILSQQVCQEGEICAGTGMSAISGDGRETERGRQTDRAGLSR